MSKYNNIRRYSNEDYIAPIVHLIVMSKKDILLNKIVPKKSTLRDILKEEGLKGKEYTLNGKPLNLDDKIIDIIPKNYKSLSKIELIIEEIQLILDNSRIYYERILKPLENPFRVLVFTPNEFDVSIKTYPNETLKSFQLNNYLETSSSYCNTPKDLYISGGRGKNFWKINSIKTNIEKLKDLPKNKENHSMIYIPKRYIYFIGGNNKDTFYYDETFDSFSSWAEMNKQVKSPALALVNNSNIYSFGEQNNNSKTDFIEKTSLKNSNSPSWETIYLKKNLVFPLKDFGAAISDDNEIYFLGGRKEKMEKTYKFNLKTQEIEICKQENTSLVPIDKNFYPLNDFNSAMIPDSKLEKDIQVVVFNKKRKKYRKVLYQKNLDEIVNNYNLDQDDSLIVENNQIKIVWKELQNNYISVDNLPENMLYLPSIEDLKKEVNDYDDNELEQKNYIIDDYETDNMENIYRNENPNVLRKGGKGRNNNNNNINNNNLKEPYTFGSSQDFKFNKDKDDKNGLNHKDMYNENRLLNDKLISSQDDDLNNINKLLFF